VTEEPVDTTIGALLPHRSPFLWIDRVLAVEPGLRCQASKHIDPAAPFFAGHFPGDPILPGVFLIEAAAQAAGVMMAASDPRPGTTKRLAAINQFKFRKPVRPGATIEIETRLLVENEGMASVSAVITVAGETVATGQLTVVSR
jgi:3-hydroxyacyl-[acyl-carrier-protein] dehydratase